MITGMVLACCGLSLAAASGYVGHNVARGDPILAPRNSAPLVIFSMVAMLTGFAGQVGGFWLFGAWWAAAVLAWFVIGFPMIVEFLNSRQPEARLGWVWISGLAGFALTAGGAIIAMP